MRPNLGGGLLRYAVSIVVVALFMFPLFWWGLSSIKPRSAIFDKDRVVFFDFVPTAINYAVTLLGRSRSEAATAAGDTFGVGGASSYDSRQTIIDSIVVAVGSTALRLLESATAEDGTISAFSGETALFITPGYRFRAADVMLTNFHLPRSTLFMLVCAFSGLATMQHAYAHAIETGYRFYSYGDACLLFRAP